MIVGVGDWVETKAGPEGPIAGLLPATKKGNRDLPNFKLYIPTTGKYMDVSLEECKKILHEQGEEVIEYVIQ